MGLLVVVLKVLLHRRIRYGARTPRTVTYRPEVAAPIALTQNRKFLLQVVRRATFQLFHQHTYAQRRWILDVKMDVVCTHNAFQYPNVLAVANLRNEVATAKLNIARQNMVAVLGYPYQMDA